MVGTFFHAGHHEGLRITIVLGIALVTFLVVAAL